MKLNKKKGQFLNETIDHWVNNSIISNEESLKLKESYIIQSFDWKRLAKYSFWTALISAVISFVSAIDIFSYVIEIFLNSSDIAISITLALISSIFYYLGLRRRKSKPEKIFSNEAIFFIGVLFTGGSILYFGEAIGLAKSHFPLLFFISTAIYSVLALWFPSKLVWIFTILSLSSWFGAETGYISGWGAYYLGMNYPLRFVLFGGVLIGISYYLRSYFRFADFFKSTYIMGLLFLFISLWLLSIFGNNSNMSLWHNSKHMDLFVWSLLFGMVAIGAIIYGLKNDDSTSRGFGITFLFINLYTKYFEYFWDSTHKAIFFLIIAISFWIIGRKAESIWNLKFLENKK